MVCKMLLRSEFPNIEKTFINVCNPPERFVDQRYYGSGDKMFLICYVTSRDHMFRDLWSLIC